MSTFAAMTAFRKIIAIFLLLGIVTSSFNQWLLFSTYSLNKEYISTVLCTNKDKPHLHCDGKCFLDIKLKELEQKNNQHQDTLKRIVETLAPAYANLLPQVFETYLENIPTPYLLPQPQGKVVSIFQPPKTV
ncbi:hypothetical protein [Pedobacter cryotolerans]|uniref:Uncharacterized protein n=1 Tax=Pedobacter cryotolerans TaxID=2571270 RepID=A0A4U1C9T0_9SPHI|nr:hypothetical protein [Pedobacter cryotolerans]TKC02588.1 hypothetical protein FA045_04745 [Pedobacter cryotolerans]